MWSSTSGLPLATQALFFPPHGPGPIAFFQLVQLYPEGNSSVMCSVACLLCQVGIIPGYQCLSGPLLCLLSGIHTAQTDVTIFQR